jgi:hypothetical protein
MQTSEALQLSDPAVVGRYLQIRSVLHDRHLARVEQLIRERYEVQTTRRIHSTLVADVRTGFVRPGEGELWPVVFLTAVDIFAALCVQIDDERVAALGTRLNGPQPIRHRSWEDWWGWQTPLSGLHPYFFEVPVNEQEDAFAAWFSVGLEWLAHTGLLLRKAAADVSG